MLRAPRTPRSTPNPQELGEPATRTTTRKALVFTGASLALAATGATIATAFLTGATASAAEDGSPRSSAAPVASHASPSRNHAAHAASVRTKAVHFKSSPEAHTAHSKAKPADHAAKHARTWAAVSKIVARRTTPKAVGHGPLPALDRLTPAGVSGPQTWLPMTPARYDNAKAIVRVTLAKHMGVRAAVVALATAMQESGLLNVNYGTSDSLGLFQQRPSMGWGTASQIMHPAYAAAAFLNALRGYEARDPGWARQPLWQSAQGVQASGYPTAYAKWEAQAAHLVAAIAPHMV